MELSANAATVSPLPMPSPPLAERALASRFTRSWSWAKVRLSPSQARATRSGTTDEAIIRNSLVFIRYLRKRSLYAPAGEGAPRQAALQRQPVGQGKLQPLQHGPLGQPQRQRPARHQRA